MLGVDYAELRYVGAHVGLNLGLRERAVVDGAPRRCVRRSMGRRWRLRRCCSALVDVWIAPVLGVVATSTPFTYRRPSSGGVVLWSPGGDTRCWL